MAADESIEIARQLILDGKYEDLKTMFAKRKIAVNTDMFGVLPIHLAAGASKNAKKTTYFLLKMGSNPNAKTKNGNLTPLHISVYRKNYDVIKLLIAEGGNPLLRDEDNRDTFAIARRLKDEYCLKLLRSFDVSNEMTEMSDSGDDDDAKSDNDCKSLVDQFETTLGNSLHKPKSSEDILSVSSDDTFVTCVGVESGSRSRVNPVEQFIVRYPLEMQLAFSGRFTTQELQVLDVEFIAAFKAAAQATGPFGPARRTPLGMRHASGRVFFNYLLFDPRMFPQLRPPLIGYDAERITLVSFLQALFYIGKGVKNRPTQHLEDAKAVLLGRNNSKSPAVSPACPAQKATSPPFSKTGNGRIQCTPSSAKIERVLSVWASQRGIVTLQLFNNQNEIEALSREACLIESINRSNLTNVRGGDMIGPVCTSWPDWKRRKYGAWLILRAFNILRMEAPPELLPIDFR